MSKKDMINPSHYQGFVDELQWIEVMQRIPEYLNNPEEFEAAVKLQVWKYLARDGQKDDSVQELKKALWYLKLLIAKKVARREGIDLVDVEEIDEYVNA